MFIGQCYDGASNMLGKSSGVATHIFAEQPKTHYTHCHGHSPSLSVKDVTKNTKILRNTMGYRRGDNNFDEVFSKTIKHSRKYKGTN